MNRNQGRVMTPETVRAREIQKPKPEAAGKPEEIDFSLLEESMRLTPWQRLIENERALALVRMLEEARSSANKEIESAS